MIKKEIPADSHLPPLTSSSHCFAVQVFQLSPYQGTGLDRSLRNQITDFYLFNFSSQHVGWRTDTRRGSKQGTGMGGGGSETSVIRRDLPSHWKFSRFQDLKQRTRRVKIKGRRSEELYPTRAGNRGTKNIKNCPVRILS